MEGTKVPSFFVPNRSQTPAKTARYSHLTVPTENFLQKRQKFSVENGAILPNRSFSRNLLVGYVVQCLSKNHSHRWL